MANPTTNYGFVLPTSTDLVTDLPADFDVALQGVDTRLKALQPGTTLGDLAYSSATANTNTRLAVGSTGQVLTVAGGVPTWAAAGGGSLTLAQVATGSLTGTSISVTGLSSYDTLMVVMNAYQSAGSNRVSIRVNNSTDTVNDRFGYYQRSGTSTTGITLVTSSNRMEANTFSTDATNANTAIFVLENCKNAGFTRVRCHSGVYTASGDSLDSWEGLYRNNQTVSSITLVSSVAWTAGTYTIYGA